MTKIKQFLGLLSILVVTGCSHQIQISPELSQLRSTGANKSNDAVGYYISAADIATEVTTPGGGGDDVKYFPYKDTEVALKTVLSQKFNKVYSVKDKINDPLIKSKGISFVFEPLIKTDSSSSSAFTWPPTDFKIDLTCTAYSIDGQAIWKKTVVGIGHAEFDEFKHDFSLSAKRAAEKAFALMRDEVLAADVFK